MDRPQIPNRPQQSQAREEVGETTQKIEETLQRRIPTPSSFIPKRIKRPIRRRIDALPPESRERWDFLVGITQIAVLVIGGFILLAAVVTILFNATIFEPGSAKEVLNGSPPVENLAYTNESVRTKRIDGVSLRQDAIIGIGVDLQNNKFQVQAEGVANQTVRMVGDGKIVVAYKGDDSPGPVPGPYPSHDALTPMLPDMIADRPAKILTNKATVNNQRGWLIAWQPTKEDLLRLLNVDLLRLQSADIDAIRAGKATVDYAIVSVVRDTRQIYQIQAAFHVNGALVKILDTYRNYNPTQIGTFNLKRSAT